MQKGAENTRKAITMEHISLESKRAEQTLFKFDCVENVEMFRLLTDADMGGKSTAVWKYDTELNCGVFEGVLDLTPPAGANNSGFAALVSSSKRAGPWDLEEFNGVKLNVRTDGRMYVTNLKASSVIEGDLWQAYTMGSNPGKWEDIVIPFNKFVLTQRGFVEGQLVLDARNVESIGILMAQRRAGPFRLELRSISAVDDSQMPGKRWTGVVNEQV